jgi:hypothetical protein
MSSAQNLSHIRHHGGQLPEGEIIVEFKTSAPSPPLSAISGVRPDTDRAPALRRLIALHMAGCAIGPAPVELVAGPRKFLCDPYIAGAPALSFSYGSRLHVMGAVPRSDRGC